MFSIKDFCEKNIHETADLVIFTTEIIDGKLHFLFKEKYKEKKNNEKLCP